MATTSAKAKKISLHDYDTYFGCLLPDDLILQIIIRLPGKSLERFKLVCKSWNSMISNPNFVKSHIEYSKLNCISKPSLIMGFNFNEEQDTIIIPSVPFDVDRSNLINIVLLAKSFPPSLEDIGCDTDYFITLGSYNGLVCIHLNGSRVLYLLNPNTHERVEVDLPPSDFELEHIHEGSWFGFVPCINDYKIILFASHYLGRRSLMRRRHYMYVYSFRHDEWRQLDTRGLAAERLRSPVLLSEALHWTESTDNSMVKFDLVKETFERIPLMKDVRGNNRIFFGPGEVYCDPKLVILENTIYWTSYLYIHEGYVNELTFFEVWKLEEYGKWDSWKRIHRIKLDEQFIGLKPIFWSFTGSGELVFTSEQEQKLVIIDPVYNTPCYEIGHLPLDQLYISVVDWFESLASPATLLYE